LGTGECSIGTVGKRFGQFAAVVPAGTHIAHVDERGIDDALIKSYGIICDNLAEGPDEEFAARRFLILRTIPTYIEVRRLAQHVLALIGVLDQYAVELPAAVPAGDDYGQAQRYPERLQRVDAQCLQVLHVFGSRLVPDPVAASGCTYGELLEPEVRG